MMTEQTLSGNKRTSSDAERSDSETEHDMNMSNSAHGSSEIVQTTKSKGIVNVQLFIRKAFAMINECDPKIACWTPEGDKFVVKDKEVFASTIIPQYYDHNNYSSFTRQLNFYGFAREQAMTIKVTDLASLAVGQETFYHKDFQRGRPDLLKNLQRKTADSQSRKKRKKPKLDDSSSAATSSLVMERLNALEKQNFNLMTSVKQLREEHFTSMTAIRDLQTLNSAKDEKIRALEKRLEWLENGGQGRNPKVGSFQPQQPTSFASNSQNQNFSGLNMDPKLASQLLRDASLSSLPPSAGGNNEPLYPNLRATSINNQFFHQHTSNNNNNNVTPVAATSSAIDANAPTLPRHPKMKKLTSAGSSNNNHAFNPTNIFLNHGNNNNNGGGDVGSGVSREASLDFGLLADLTRESSLMSWLPRQNTEPQATQQQQL